MNAESLTRALGGRWNGKSGAARCPAHDDRTASFSIADGNNGNPVVHCHAGCGQDAVLEALRARGLWPDRPDPFISHRRGTRRPPESSPPIDAPAPDFAAILGTDPNETWTYHNAEGAPQYYVARIDKREGGKVVLPVSFDGQRWISRAPPDPRPLYRMPDLLADPRKPVLVVEGEKTAEAAAELVTTHVVTTWSGGSNAVGKTDWSTLKGRHVVLWPDNDDPGRKAMRAIADLLTSAASVRGVKLPDGLPSGWDLADPLPADLDPVSLIGSAKDLRAARLAGLKLTTAAALVAHHFKPVKYAVPNLFCEGLSLFAGRPKTGKSWLTLGSGVAVAAGGKALGDIECEQGDVLALLLEDTPRRLGGRLKAVLQGGTAPERLEIATEWRKADEGGLEDIRLWLQAHPDARMVIIDTLAKIRGKEDPRKGVYANDYDVISGFKALADEFGVAIVLVHHLKKGSETDPLDAVSGTSGLTGAADTILVLKREPNDLHGILYVRGRDVPEAEMALQFDQDTGQWSRAGTADDFRKSEARRAILRALSDGGAMTPREVADVIGQKPANVRVLLSKMRKSGEVSQWSNGRYQCVA